MARHGFGSPLIGTLVVLCLAVFLSVVASAQPMQNPLVASSASASALSQSATAADAASSQSSDDADRSWEPSTSAHDTLKDLIHALDSMQVHYFKLWQGTWPTSIDWTAAVLGKHLSATLSTLSATPKEVLSLLARTLGDDDDGDEALARVEYENLISVFFSHVSSFYFGENAFSLRSQAFDDMLWVVLGWLENIKLQELHSGLHYTLSASQGWKAHSNNSWMVGGRHTWHGTQFRVPAAHRARLFYELASAGWERTLCGGGMLWNPYLLPYKNAVTNELFISASVAMYLYFPGDQVQSPYASSSSISNSGAHNQEHLLAAIEGYRWLKNSRMTGIFGLYADGFHISRWKSWQDPGTRQCDELNPMVYTYNQGVILSGLSGLWLATASAEYLDDAHDLVQRVIKATGWSSSTGQWAGLGRDGIIEDTCDSFGTCTNDGQSFKGIFFHHLAEFCRPLRAQEEQFLVETVARDGEENDWQGTYEQHRAKCRSYGPWIEHNANAALMTRDVDGKFGMWWGRPYGQSELARVNSSVVPALAVDYRNMMFNESEVYGNSRGTPFVSSSSSSSSSSDCNDRGRGRTVETQGAGVAVLRALYQWKTLGLF